MTQDKQKWSYLAGLIDGEGCIGISSKWVDAAKYNARRNPSGESTADPYKMVTFRISITNTNLNLMKWLISSFGGVYYTKREATEKHKASYEWRPKGMKNMEILLLSTIPYLIIKKEQAKLGLEYIRLAGTRNPEKRNELYQRSLVLNRKGITPTTNTSNSSESELKIESELMGDYESTPVVTQVPSLEELNESIKKSWRTALDNAATFIQEHSN